MAEYVKLTEPGAFATILVATVKEVTTGKWPDYQLADENGITLVIPQKAADRQLARLLCRDVHELVGQWVTISRSTESGANGKLYWNLDVGAAEEHRPLAPKAPAASPKQNGGSNGNGARAQAAAPITDEERQAIAEKKAAERRRLRDYRHAMFVDEAIFQLRAAAKIAKEHPEFPPLEVTAASVNAASSTDFIEYNKRSLL